jgi:hypothetical protein
MDQIELSHGRDDRWTVTLPSLIVTSLSNETAEAFDVAWRRRDAAAARPISRPVSDQASASVWRGRSLPVDRAGSRGTAQASYVAP